MVIVAATCVETLASAGKHILDCSIMNTLERLCLQIQWIVESITFQKERNIPIKTHYPHILSARSYKKF